MSLYNQLNFDRATYVQIVRLLSHPNRAAVRLLVYRALLYNRSASWSENNRVRKVAARILGLSVFVDREEVVGISRKEVVNQFFAHREGLELERQNELRKVGFGELSPDDRHSWLIRELTFDPFSIDGSAEGRKTGNQIESPWPYDIALEKVWELYTLSQSAEKKDNSLIDPVKIQHFFDRTLTPLVQNENFHAALRDDPRLADIFVATLNQLLDSTHVKNDRPCLISLRTFYEAWVKKYGLSENLGRYTLYHDFQRDRLGKLIEAADASVLWSSASAPVPPPVSRPLDGRPNGDLGEGSNGVRGTAADSLLSPKLGEFAKEEAITDPEAARKAAAEAAAKEAARKAEARTKK